MGGPGGHVEGTRVHHQVAASLLVHGGQLGEANVKADAHANSIFLVNGKPRVSIAQQRTDGTNWTKDWHHVRIKRDIQTGSIQVFFDDMKKPVMTTIDKHFNHGRVGIGSFDDTGDFDNFLLRGSVHKPKE